MPIPRLVSILNLGLLSFEISRILVFLRAVFCGMDPPGTLCPNSCRAALLTCLVELSRCSSPWLSTSRAIFFILPCIFLNPYAAAFLVVIWSLPVSARAFASPWVHAPRSTTYCSTVAADCQVCHPFDGVYNSVGTHLCPVIASERRLRAKRSPLEQSARPFHRN